MTEMAVLQIVLAIGWLVLVGSAYASYQKDWGKTAQQALTWVAIFGGAFLLVSLIRG